MGTLQGLLCSPLKSGGFFGTFECTSKGYVERGTYRVFFFILTQEWASCETILGLLRPQMASMGFQDWAQITFR